MSSSTSRATRTSATRASSTCGVGGAPTRGYECAWAHDLDAEKAAFERFIDRVVAPARRAPRYARLPLRAARASKLRSLSVKYATREAEVDDLLRDEVLVDLYAVVRQGLQVGEDSYSLKKLERHHGFVRLEKRVREGGGSIVAYETWLETGDDDLLEAIRAYNEEDCTLDALAARLAAGHDAPRGRGRVRRRLRRAARTGARGGARPA